MNFYIEIFELPRRAWVTISGREFEHDARVLYNQTIVDYPGNSVRCIQLIAQHNAIIATGVSIEVTIKEHPEAYEAGKKDKTSGVASRESDWDFEASAKVAYQAGYGKSTGDGK